MIKDVPLSPLLKKSLDPSEPEGVRLAFAAGEIPMNTVEKLSTYTILREDPSPKVVEAAEKSLSEIPESEIENALSMGTLPGVLLHTLAQTHGDRNAILLRLLTHQHLFPETAGLFADSEDELVVRAIAENFSMLKKSEGLVERILLNPALPAENAKRVRIAFGIVNEEMLLEEEPAPSAPSRGDEGEEVEVRTEEIAPSQEEEPKAPEDEEITDEPSGESDEPPAGGDLPEGGITEDELREQAPELFEEEAPIKDSQNIYQLIQGLSIAEKIKLATLGSAGARKLLARDTNRTVVMAVVKSPKIREDEILLVANDKMTPDEAITYILTKKEWLKHYPLRLTLAQNPKTPIPRAIRLLETLMEKDLRSISKSKNVPSIIATSALRVLQRRGKA